MVVEKHSRLVDSTTSTIVNSLSEAIDIAFRDQ